MAAKGFIELLRLSQRGKKNLIEHNDETYRWSGIAFEMMGQLFVAPLGEVSEVIFPPKFTTVPKVQNWIKGIANIRGRLLSIADLACFLTGQNTANTATQKIICVSHHEHYMGLSVERVLGIQHFNKKSYFLENPDLNSKVKPYCSGYFHQHNQMWNIFLFSRLLKDPHYMNVTEKR
ncbi:chemotaxis protein CheW [Acinetobacter stercoris]|uniref:Chemotaxis protein CheW n=1 Tax=Acinetobacter stercoris TaxID=2126983 RepID=A0A2U3N1T0_9GAMM|nr:MULTISPECIES: chemotaxis protein CheW [Acinetobacter]SPL71621.1 Chemotaxis protein CheW [Acinetobacter stercoris]